MNTRRGLWTVRFVGTLVAVLSVAALFASAGAAPPSQPTAPTEVVDEPTGTTPGGIQPNESSATRRGVTVVTTQGFYTGTHPGARDVAEIVAFDASGTVVYHNATHDVYFDVDPVPGTRMTVEYVAADRLGGSACRVSQCSLNLVEQLNLSTGEVTRVYDAVTPQYDTGRWHDVDRLNATHLVVADIVHDRVYVVDTRTDEITWQWNASEHYSPSAGGGTGDWTHVNDVEVLADGRFMVSLRNMDSVVFLRPGVGIDEDWTLGAHDAHDVLYESHNPDYIPADHGGPAVVLANSENNRVVEYHRRDGGWTLAWSWRDRTLQWPRDADRLPNGHTLVVDSHGDRVVEIDTTGTVVWAVEVGRAYDAERLGTGDESSGGYAAGSRPGTGAASPPATNQRPAIGGLTVALKDALPGRLINGLLFVAPPWVDFTDLLVAGVLSVDLLLWGGVEWRCSNRSLRGGLWRIRARFE
jgi:hypothetical protein